MVACVVGPPAAVRAHVELRAAAVGGEGRRAQGGHRLIGGAPLRLLLRRGDRAPERVLLFVVALVRRPMLTAEPPQVRPGGDRVAACRAARQHVEPR